MAKNNDKNPNFIEGLGELLEMPIIPGQTAPRADGGGGENMDLNDPTETIVIYISAAINAAAKIRDSITQTLDKIDPNGDSLSNAQMCGLRLASVAGEVDELRENLSKALNDYIRKRGASKR